MKSKQQLLVLGLLFNFYSVAFEQVLSEQVPVIHECEIEQSEEPDVDFDALFGSNFDPETHTIAPQENRLVDYLPVPVRTVGFALFVAYIRMHTAIKTAFITCAMMIKAKISKGS